MSEKRIKCPFCAEDILEEAKKCRYCGEWLQGENSRTGTDITQRGSTDARAVTRGLKEKEYQDTMFGCGGFLSLVVAAVLGFWLHWIVGVIAFIILLGLLGSWYWKE